MKTVMAVLSVAVLLSGCASYRCTFYPENVSEEERKRDLIKSPVLLSQQSCDAWCMARVSETKLIGKVSCKCKKEK
jgi:uncharacterized protein YceK